MFTIANTSPKQVLDDSPPTGGPPIHPHRTRGTLYTLKRKHGRLQSKRPAAAGGDDDAARSGGKSAAGGVHCSGGSATSAARWRGVASLTRTAAVPPRFCGGDASACASRQRTQQENVNGSECALCGGRRGRRGVRGARATASCNANGAVTCFLSQKAPFRSEMSVTRGLYFL